MNFLEGIFADGIAGFKFLRTQIKPFEELAPAKIYAIGVGLVLLGKGCRWLQDRHLSRKKYQERS